MLMIQFLCMYKLIQIHMEKLGRGIPQVKHLFISWKFFRISDSTPVLLCNTHCFKSWIVINYLATATTFLTYLQPLVTLFCIIKPWEKKLSQNVYTLSLLMAFQKYYVTLKFHKPWMQFFPYQDKWKGLIWLKFEFLELRIFMKAFIWVYSIHKLEFQILSPFFFWLFFPLKFHF